MLKLTASETLIYLINNLVYYLEELNEIKSTDNNELAYGEKTAYTECLEMIQYWEDARFSGLDFNIEECFPL